jgi:hypothetical protein
MDGGVKQEEMSEQIKREVKENAHRRRGQRVAHVPDDRPITKIFPDRLERQPWESSTDHSTSITSYLDADSNLDIDQTEPSLGPSPFCPRINQELRKSLVLTRGDCLLVAFYLENLLPILFPFYRPSFIEGGRAWILEMMMSSPVVRQATMFQSFYFFHLARGETEHDEIWEQTLQKTTEAFGVLRQALRVIDGQGIACHTHGAARIMASIMQIHRFEINVSSFQNWQSHLSAALALFIQILTSALDSGTPSSRFNVILNRLGPSSLLPSAWGWPDQNGHIPSPDQAGFRFSSALVIFDDIIASVVLQEQPKLYGYHRSLLSNIDGTIDGTNKPRVNVESVLGLKNWTLLHIGEIASLEAWKRQCSAVGNLDVVELVHRAAATKEALAALLMQLDAGSETVPDPNVSLLDSFSQPPLQSSLVTRVWTHAALIYLYIVVSGWQPASSDVRYHVSEIIQLLNCQTSPALLRTMAWPFCVAGCLAEPSQEEHFRSFVGGLKPPGIFGTLQRALDIMENTWRNRGADNATRSLSSCFRLEGHLVLLV